MFPFCGKILFHCAVMGAMFFYCCSSLYTTEMLERCVLPPNAGVKVWNRCTKMLIDACQPGMYKIGNCTGQKSCKSCPEGTFTSGWNNCSSCFLCSICEYGIEEPCSAERNTRCKEAPESNHHDTGTFLVTTVPSRDEPTSSLSTSTAADLDLISTTSDQNHSFPPALAKTESGCDCRNCGIHFGTVHIICIMLAFFVLLLLPGNVFYLRNRMRKPTVETSIAPGRRQVEFVENGQANSEKLLEHVGIEIEVIDNREQAG